MRFHTLYGVVVKDEFDALEFAEDDFYAFQVLDRAFRSDNQELRNLAAHLQTQREAALETITLRATEILESTRRLKTLELQVLQQKGESGDVPPQAVAPEPPDRGGEPEASFAAPAEQSDKPATADSRRRRKGWLR